MSPWRTNLVSESSNKPTNKVASAAIVTVILFLLSLVTDVDPQIEQAVNVAVPIVVAYFVRNSQTPGGIPPKT